MLKKSISINGHPTSIALERPFWDELESAAVESKQSVPKLIAAIDIDRMTKNPVPGLASSLRVFVVNRLQKKTQPFETNPIDGRPNTSCE